MSEENEIVKHESKEVNLFDVSEKGLKLLETTVTSFAKLQNCDRNYVMDAFTKANAMGIKDPFVALSMFWEMNKKAELKTKALQKHLLDGRWIVEPFTLVKDCEPLYYYYNINELKLLIEGEGNTFYQKFVAAKGKENWQTIAKLLKPQLFYKESNPDLAKLGLEGRSKEPYDYVTTLEAVTVDATTGKFKRTPYSYRYSTACAKGIPYTNFKDFQDGKITKDKLKVKSTWIDKGWMMLMRCASKLSDVIAPGAIYSSEGRYSGQSDEVLGREHDLFIKTNGRKPNTADAGFINKDEILEAEIINEEK